MTLTAPAPSADAPFGPPPFRRPEYAAETYFRCNAATGIVTQADGQRVVRASIDLLAHLHRALTAEMPSAAEPVLTTIGRRWGDADMRAFTGRAGDEFGAPYETVHMDVLLRTWWWPRAAGGWGAWTFDFARAPQRLVFLDLRESAESRALGETGRPACHLTAGYFAGGLSVLARRDLECVELECHSAGAATCRFLFSTSANVERARGWRDSGESADEIARKLIETA